jgi:hypothetical protein
MAGSATISIVVSDMVLLVVVARIVPTTVVQGLYYWLFVTPGVLP